MPIGLIFKRFRREWRLLAILLFAVSLITGFFALGPLYIRSVTEVDLRYALGNANPDALKVTILSNNELGPTEQAIVEEELGDLVTDVDRYKRAAYSAPVPGSNQNTGGIAGIAVCGFNFTLGVNPQAVGGVAGFMGNCFQPFAFDRLDQKVRVVEGRLPQRGPTPNMVDATGLTDEQQQELQVGNYNRGEVEAVVTTAVVEAAANSQNPITLELGMRFFLGTATIQGNTVTRVRIVGIVEVLDPNDPFWLGNQMFVNGANVDIDTLGNQRYDFGLAFHPAAYEDWVRPILPVANITTNYLWRFDVDTDVITSVNAAEYEEALENVQNRLSATGNTVNVTTGLSGLLGGYQDRIDSAEGPIILLSGAILVLMLYHLITTVTLVLQQQGKEWSTITSRGGSTAQLFKLQFVTILVIVVVSFLAGPILSRGFMVFMEVSGPLADALDGVDIGNVSIPTRSYQLSLAAALVCLLVLSFPAVPAATRSLLLLKQAASRPPTRPRWARFFLDFVLILVGFAFMMRLYWTVGGKDPVTGKDKPFADLMADLVNKPNEVVKLIADNAASTGGGLTDPFNLIAPALILTGFALFWLRLFPFMMTFLSRLSSRSSRLATPLAVWNVERDPGHYAQLVLLLIGTLALGTASLGLSATRDIGGWDTAQGETGGTVRADLDPRIGEYTDVNWDRLDGVSESTPILYQITDAQGTQAGISVLGVDPADFERAFPEFAGLLSGLDEEPFETSGILLPDNAADLQVQIWSESLAVPAEGIPDVSVVLYAYVNDVKGIPFRIEMTQPSNVGDFDAVAGNQSTPTTTTRLPTTTGQWVTLTGEMPTLGTPPYRLWRIGIGSEQGDLDAFTHTLYLDYWQTVDANGTATPVDNQGVQELWQRALAINPYPGVWQNLSLDERVIAGLDTLEFVGPETVAAFDGTDSLKVTYTIRTITNRSNEPSIGVNQFQVAWIPAVVSDDFADEFRSDPTGGARSTRSELTIGGQRTIQLTTRTGNIDIGLRVVNIVEEFPYLTDDSGRRFFIILPFDTARALINQTLLNRAPSSYADVNQVWFELEDRKPTEEFKSQLEGIESVTNVVYAWDRFGEILREPLPSAVAGMLFAGFWVSFVLSLLDFAFYIAVTAKQRSFSFGVLRSLGWNANKIWQMLLLEQITLVTPALLIGSLLGAALAYLLLPFLALVGNASLQLPFLDIIGLIFILIVGFSLLLLFTAYWLRRMSVNQVLRLGEE